VINNEKVEYKDAWEEPAAAPLDDTNDEFATKGANEERSLADKLAAGEGDKYAAGDGFKGDGVMTTKAHEAYKEATGEYMDGTKPAEKAPVTPNNNPGKDDQMTKDWKSRNAERQRNEGIEKLMKTRKNITRDQAEKMIPLSQ